MHPHSPCPQVRFLHEPSKAHGFVGAALASNVVHFTKDETSGKWVTSVVIRQPWVKVGLLSFNGKGQKSNAPSISGSACCAVFVADILVCRMSDTARY